MWIEQCHFNTEGHLKLQSFFLSMPMLWLKRIFNPNLKFCMKNDCCQLIWQLLFFQTMKTVESGYILFKRGLMGSFSLGFCKYGGGYILFKGGLIGSFSLGFCKYGGGYILFKGGLMGSFSLGFCKYGGRGDIFSSREV